MKKIVSKIINGKNHSKILLNEITKLTSRYNSINNRQPCLAVIIVGHNIASKIYVKNKIKTANLINIKSIEVSLSEDITEEDLLNEIKQLNQDMKIDGILVQLPLPKHIVEKKVINAISPFKDVDGFHPINFGNLVLGNKTIVPCTPLGCWYMLKNEVKDLSGCHTVIVGRSNIVGKPIQSLMLKENCTVTITHSKTKNLSNITNKADILIAAIGKPEYITKKFMKTNSIIIDVGINRLNKKLVGDVKFNDAIGIAKKITPVPGGVGPMTIACLMYNTVKLAFSAKNQSFNEILL